MKLGISMKLWLLVLAMAASSAMGCSDDKKGGGGDGGSDSDTGGGDGDTDTDTDTDVDTDTDTDVDTDTDTDVDTDTDTDVDADTDTDVDTDVDADTDTDVDADTDTDVDADTDTDVDADTDTDVDADTDTDVDADTDTDVDADTDTDVDTDTDTDIDADTDTDVDTDTDTDTDADTAVIGDLDEVILDEMESVRIHVYASPSGGSSSEDHSNIDVDFANFHTPIPGQEPQLLFLDTQITNSGGNAFLNLQPSVYQVHLRDFNGCVGGGSCDGYTESGPEYGLMAANDSANNEACGEYTTSTTFGCNGYDFANIPTLETAFNFENPEGSLIINKQAARINFTTTIENNGFETLTMDNVKIRIFAVNEDGLPVDNVGSNGQIATLDYVDGADESLGQAFSASVEAFEGYYRIIATGEAHQNVDDQTTMDTATEYDTNDTDAYDTETDTIQVEIPPATETVTVYPFVSEVIAVGEEETDDIEVGIQFNITDNKKNANVVLLDATASGAGAEEPPIVGRNVRVYDCETGWYINTVETDAEGKAVVPVGNFYNVVAIANLTDSGSGGVHFTNVATNPNKTIKEVFLDGEVAPAASIATTPNATQITMMSVLDTCKNPLDSIEGGPLPFVGKYIYPKTSDPDKGTFLDERIWTMAPAGSIDGLDYDVTVQYLKDYFLLETLEKTYSDVDTNELNIDVDDGGTLYGVVTRHNGGSEMEDVYVQAVSADGANYDVTDVNGEYEIPLPAGTYTVYVSNVEGGSARTEDVEIQTNEATELNFVYGQYSGHVETADNVEVDQATIISTGVCDPSDDSGNFTCEFWEGLNWVCVNPKSSDDGDKLEFQCFYEISVSDADFQ